MARSYKPWRVVHPRGTRWAVQFKSEDSAWSRVANFTQGRGRGADPKFRDELRAKGWKVRKVEDLKQ